MSEIPPRTGILCSSHARSFGSKTTDQPIICMCTRRLVRHGVEVSTSVVFSFLFFFSPPSHLSLLSVSASLLQRHPLHSWCQFRLGPPSAQRPHQEVQDVMRALHWDACGAKAFCVPLPESGARGWGVVYGSGFGDGSGSSSAENATPHTSHLARHTPSRPLSTLSIARQRSERPESRRCGSLRARGDSRIEMSIGSWE